MKDSSKNIFWASYADLMTALFIITLVLFVLSYKMFKDKATGLEILKEELSVRGVQLANSEAEVEDLRGYLVSQRALADTLIKQLDAERGRLIVMEEEYRKLREMEEAISRLDPLYFEYQPEYKRHILKSQVQFPTGKSYIGEQYHDLLYHAGLELKRLIDSLDVTDNIKYMLVLEGSASKDNYAKNYQLSYDRALELYNLWKKQGINFDPDIIEVIISGSGTGGVGRVVGNEKLNQRFIIQIIPKVGTFDMVDWEKLDEISNQLSDEKEEEAEN
ncbi:hypothetical protein [Flexithrix dorotheae]|uniref:hypothetical protein n=1 Tax=Flexithrix dorotheae TaxID=70993 RepID=UPI000371E0F2|nr:hypothetical protein [Flexithrix dorotheae]